MIPQALYLLALYAGLEGEVELIRRLHRRQPRGAHGGLESAVIAHRDLGVQELPDGHGRGVIAPPSASDRMLSTASSAPGILRSASIALSLSRRLGAGAVIAAPPHRR